MATNTTNYGLIKPETTDAYNIAVFNTNADTIDSALADKVDTETGKVLSTNDYTDDDKAKLTGIEDAAEVNIVETVKVNGSALPVTTKAVNITVPVISSGTDAPSGGSSGDIYLRYS